MIAEHLHLLNTMRASIHDDLNELSRLLEKKKHAYVQISAQINMLEGDLELMNGEPVVMDLMNMDENENEVKLLTSDEKTSENLGEKNE